MVSKRLMKLPGAHLQTCARGQCRGSANGVKGQERVNLANLNVSKSRIFRLSPR